LNDTPGISYFLKSNKTATMSTVAQLVRDKVEEMPSGKVFDYGIFVTALPDAAVESIALSLSRLSREGVIERLEKGKYYKPKKSSYGKIRPKESDIIAILTIKNKERIGYPTGLPVFNQMGLTTQVSNTLIIATSKPKEPKNLQGIKVKYIKRLGQFQEEEIRLWQILDAIQDINAIPDATPDESVKILKRKIGELPRKGQERLVGLAEAYQPRTRALLGAMIEYYFDEIDTGILKKKINRLSKFDIGVSAITLPNKSSWNIK
jgi:hypothetical protein